MTNRHDRRRRAKLNPMVSIDISPLEPFLDDELAADIRARGNNCQIAGRAPCPSSGRTILFSFDLGGNGSHPFISLSIAEAHRATDAEVEWFFRFSNVVRGVEFRPKVIGYLRHFKIGNTFDGLTFLPGGAA